MLVNRHHLSRIIRKKLLEVDLKVPLDKEKPCTLDNQPQNIKQIKIYYSRQLSDLRKSFKQNKRATNKNAEAEHAPKLNTVLDAIDSLVKEKKWDAAISKAETISIKNIKLPDSSDLYYSEQHYDNLANKTTFAGKSRAGKQCADYIRCMKRVDSAARIENGKIVFDEKIYFDFDKSTIKPESNGILDDIAKVINGDPKIIKIRIEGHTDHKGSDEYNLKLSQSRAESVKKALVNRKVKEAILVTQGKGEKEPVNKEKTKAAMAQNRRVEFIILEPKNYGGASKSETQPGPGKDRESKDQTREPDGTSKDSSSSNSGSERNQQNVEKETKESIDLSRWSKLAGIIK